MGDLKLSHGGGKPQIGGKGGGGNFMVEEVDPSRHYGQEHV